MSLQNPVGPEGPGTGRPNLWGPLRMLMLVGFLSGCAGATANNPFASGANTDVFSFMVYSQHDYHVDIYVNPSGKRQRLGTVRPNQQEFFQFRYPASRPLMVELESELGESYRIPSTVFTGGGRVDLRIARNLRDSRFIRRDP